MFGDAREVDLAADVAGVAADVGEVAGETLLVFIANGGQLHAGKLEGGFGMGAAHEAKTDYAEFHGAHYSGRMLHCTRMTS